jgi:hypothetical protein
MVTNTGRFQMNRRTAAQWTAANTVLLAGELGVETDTHKVKGGDGTTAWTALPYIGDASVAGVTTVNSRSGAVVLAKSDVGLSAVDNTADTAKPVSTAQAAALALKITRPTGGSAGQYLSNDGAGGQGWATVPASPLPTVRAVTASTTLGLGDADNVVTNTGATNITVTVPTNATATFPLESSILIRMLGTGIVTLAPVSGTVLLRSPAGLRLTTQYAQATLTKIGTDTWLVGGFTVV